MVSAKPYLRKAINFYKKLARKISYRKKLFFECLFILTVGRLMLLSRNKPNKQNVLMMMQKSYFLGSKDTSTETDLYEVLSQYVTSNIPQSSIFAWHFDRRRPFPIFRFAFLLSKSRPSLVVLSSHSEMYPQGSYFTRSFLRWCGQAIPGLQFCEIGWDTVGKDFWSAEFVSKLPRHFIVLDAPSLKTIPIQVRSIMASSGFLISSCAQPFVADRWFQSYNSPRSIDCSFVGLTGAYRNYRDSYLNYVKEFVPGSLILTAKNRQEQVPHLEYRRILQNSKISINFSESISGQHQIKGRVWESLLSGCLLIEQLNDEINHFFQDGVHYVSFSTKEELVEKLVFYSSNVKARKEIAMRGQERAISLIGQGEFGKLISRIVQFPLL